jgi:hypothetical protein
MDKVNFFYLNGINPLHMKYVLALLLVLTGVTAFSQSEVLKLSPGLNLPKDSVTRDQLLGSLRDWLGQPDKSAFEVPEDRAAMAMLTDEIKGLGDFTCYLTNVVALGGERFRVQLAYMRVKDMTPELRACCTVVAQQKEGKFYFSSILKESTEAWKTRTIGNCTFHYRRDLNTKKAAQFQKKIALYDSKLTAAPQAIDYYCCGNFVEASRLMGLEYKSDYNGHAFDAWSGFADNRTVYVSGEKWIDHFSDWDPHDSWHDRLAKIVHSPTINRPVDEACAYLYGGSWRVYSPDEILRRFREYAASHPNADWVALYKDGTDFVPGPKILKVSYAINALIVQQLEKEKGFPAVLELLSCGKREKGDANYFTAIKRLTGIDEPQYNQFVWKLIRS